MRFKKGSKVKVMNKEVRASCHDDRWIPVGKVLRNSEVEPSYSMTILQKKVDCLPVYNDVRFKKSKRASPFRSSNNKAKKVKLAEKDCGRSQRHSFEKVDAFEGKEYTQASFNYTLNGYYKTENKKRKTYESDNDQCSVGSCSVLSDGYNNKLSSHSDVDILSSDGESFNTSRVELEHEVAASVHRLELHAYRSTLEALYASGPLSWEKEAVLTNLRISLHISNDEHLTELKHLISSGSRVLD